MRDYRTMPFDTTKLRQPTVTVLPPAPPERGGGPQRVHIEIVITDQRAPPRRGYRFGTLTLWLLVLALALALFGCTAHAQPSQWSPSPTYEHLQGRIRSRRSCAIRPARLPARHPVPADDHAPPAAGGRRLGDRQLDGTNEKSPASSALSFTCARTS
jgi:hypothetical protein